MNAVAVANAVALAFGREVSESFYHAICDNPQEAKDMAFEASVRRREAASLARAGWSTNET
jgi:hypothetical protein